MMEKILDVQDVNTRDMTLSGLDLTSLCHTEWMVLVQELDVSQNHLTSLKPLGNLPCLVVLIANNNDIDSVEGLQHCKQLKKLHLQKNGGYRLIILILQSNKKNFKFYYFSLLLNIYLNVWFISFFPYSFTNSASLQYPLLSPIRGCECIRESVVQYWELHWGPEGDSSNPCPKLRAIFLAFAPSWGRICHSCWCQRFGAPLGLTEQDWWQCDILTIYGPIDFIMLYNYILCSHFVSHYVIPQSLLNWPIFYY